MLEALEAFHFLFISFALIDKDEDTRRAEMKMTGPGEMCVLLPCSRRDD